MSGPRRDLLDKLLLALSVVFLVLQAEAAALHALPSLVIPATRSATSHLIAQILALGPYWVGAFGITAVLLAGSLIRQQARHITHLLCSVVWMFYATSLWLGAFGSSPHGTVFYPSLATVLLILHFLLGWAYNAVATRGGAR